MGYAGRCNPLILCSFILLYEKCRFLWKIKEFTKFADYYSKDMLYQNMDVCADRRFAFKENENETGNDYREYGRFLSPGQDDSDRTFQKPENFSRKNKAYGVNRYSEWKVGCCGSQRHL